MTLSESSKSIIKSTATVLGLSFLAGFAATLAGVSFWAGFFSAAILQYIVFSFVGSFLTHYISESRRKLELDKLESLSTILQCAYCHKPNLMTFNPNDVERIEFECDACKKRNLVTMQFTVVQISQPLEIPKVIGIPSEGI